MSRLWLRLFLAACLLASMLLHARAMRAEQQLIASFDIYQAITRVLSAHDVEILRSGWPRQTVQPRTVYFQRRGCSAASVAMPFHITTDASAKILNIELADRRQTIKYLEKSWRKQQSFELIMDWTSNAMLAAAGRSPYATVRQAILLIEPAQCSAGPDPVDWAQVWRLPVPLVSLLSGAMT